MKATYKKQWEKAFEAAEQKIHANELNAKLQAELSAVRDFQRPGLKRTSASYARPGSAWAKWYDQKIIFMESFTGDVEGHCQEIISERRKLLRC